MYNSFMNGLKIGKYKHYKGHVYSVIGVGRDSESLQEVVIYKGLYENEFGKNPIWVRPLKMFLENVVVNGKEVPRFEYLEPA